jgi:hypothetical protein
MNKEEEFQHKMNEIVKEYEPQGFVMAYSFGDVVGVSISGDTVVCSGLTLYLGEAVEKNRNNLFDNKEEL